VSEDDRRSQLEMICLSQHLSLPHRVDDVLLISIFEAASRSSIIYRDEFITRICHMSNLFVQLSSMPNK
jgi:hypothetical protein